MRLLVTWKVRLLEVFFFIQYQEYAHDDKIILLVVQLEDLDGP